MFLRSRQSEKRRPHTIGPPSLRQRHRSTPDAFRITCAVLASLSMDVCPRNLPVSSRQQWQHNQVWASFRKVDVVREMDFRCLRHVLAKRC